MISTAQDSYLGYLNPLVSRVYQEYLNFQTEEYVKEYEDLSKKQDLENIVSALEKNNDALVKKLTQLYTHEYITIENYLQVSKQIGRENKGEYVNLINKIANNQDAFINRLLEFMNTALHIISDEGAINKILNNEQNAVKRSYVPTVLRIQKLLFGQLRDEMSKSATSNWRVLADVPILKYLALAQRLKRLNKFTRPIAATNIVGIRLIEIFDKTKIKKEITQAYEEFAEAGLLEPKYKFDKHSEYISNSIKMP